MELLIFNICLNMDPKATTIGTTEFQTEPLKKKKEK